MMTIAGNLYLVGTAMLRDVRKGVDAVGISSSTLSYICNELRSQVPEALRDPCKVLRSGCPIQLVYVRLCECLSPGELTRLSSLKTSSERQSASSHSRCTVDKFLSQPIYLAGALDIFV